MRLDVPVREGRLTVLLEPPKSKDSDTGMSASGEHAWDVETSELLGRNEVKVFTVQENNPGWCQQERTSAQGSLPGCESLHRAMVGSLGLWWSFVTVLVVRHMEDPLLQNLLAICLPVTLVQFELHSILTASVVLSW